MTRREQAILLGLAAAIVLGAAVLWWRGGGGGMASESAGPGPSGDDAEADEVYVVSITGAVHEPGVYRFDAGARLVDALEHAGGAQPEADTGSLNLAARLIDGTTLHVPKVGESNGANLNPEAYRIRTVAGAGAQGSETMPLVNVNTASREELEGLPGIGPTYAEAILRYRESAPFRKKSDLLYVQGIGPKRFEGIRDLIAVE